MSNSGFADQGLAGNGASNQSHIIEGRGNHSSPYGKQLPSYLHAAVEISADTGQRGSRVGELYEVVDAAMVHKTTAEWMAVLGELDIPAMPVNDLAGMLEDPQLLASGFFEHYDHPTEGRLMGTNFPVRFSEMSESAPALAPGLGEHTRAVLQGLDFDDDAIDALLADGVVVGP